MDFIGTFVKNTDQIISQIFEKEKVLDLHSSFIRFRSGRNFFPALNNLFLEIFYSNSDFEEGKDLLKIIAKELDKKSFNKIIYETFLIEEV